MMDMTDPPATVTVPREEYERMRAEEKLGLEHRVLQSERIERLLAECVNADTSYRHMRDRYEELARENQSLRLYYKDWREQQDAVARLRAALMPMALLGRHEVVAGAAERGVPACLLVGEAYRVTVNAGDFRHASRVYFETEPNPNAETSDGPA